MSRNEQKRFVRDLIRSVSDKVQADIDAGRVPEEWDGIELRLLLAERFENATIIPGRKRLREYKNTVLVNDL